MLRSPDYTLIRCIVTPYLQQTLSHEFGEPSLQQKLWAIPMLSHYCNTLWAIVLLSHPYITLWTKSCLSRPCNTMCWVLWLGIISSLIPMCNWAETNDYLVAVYEEKICQNIQRIIKRNETSQNRKRRKLCQCTSDTLMTHNQLFFLVNYK